jgi:class 3 adenylate cyclase
VNGPIVIVRQPGMRPLRVQVTDRLELGRECDGLVLLDPQVSRRHAELRFTEGRVTVADLGSRNGTFIGDEPLAGETELRPSVIVRLGLTTVELDEPPAHENEPEHSMGTSESPIGPRPQPHRTSIDIVTASALAERSRLNLEATDAGTVTILFSDIEGSTELATKLGDTQWFEVLATHNSIFRSQLPRFEGYEAMSQGDGFMLTFPSARRAVRYAIATQRSLNRSDLWRRAVVRVRIGIHVGEAIVDDAGALVGRHVHVASRIANLAVGGEILVSSLVREIVVARGDIVFGPGRTVALKGIEGTCIVHPLDWEASTPPL